MARPKKVVLSVSATEKTGSLRRFLLTNKGYQVWSVTTAAEAIGLLEEWSPAAPALLMTSHNLSGGVSGNALCGFARAMVPTLPTLLLLETREIFGGECHARAMLQGADTEELLQTVKQMVRLKRGPKQERHQPMKAMPAAVWTRRKEVA